MSDWTDFYGPNAGYVAELYERFLRDPESVDPADRERFARWQGPTATLATASAPEAGTAPAPLPASAATITSPLPTAVGVDLSRVVGASSLAQAIRAFGHLAAQIDPLGTPPHGDPALNPATHGITEADLAALPANVVGGPAAQHAANALEAIQALRGIYCHTTGYEFDHDHEAEERAWLREAVEAGHFCLRRDPYDEVGLLRRLSEVEGFERYLHRTFPGQTRFSIEGLDMLVPMLDEVVGCAAETGTCEMILAMAHRGRLNVLAHVLGKPYELILAEFEGIAQRGIGPAEGISSGWSGDVKYHLGARKAYRTGDVISILVTMAPNPSHLEYVNPVIEGMARASDDDRYGRGEPTFYEAAALPVVIHGDAAFTGQGIVAETINLSALKGYQTGGTIHIIANNQLGFTGEPFEERSTLHASDLAKGFEIPIVHVNADDPDACIAAIRLAAAYRQRFHRDFLVDLVGYRRWGHNEGDEPAFTQPRMYATIGPHPTVRDLWARQLVTRGLLGEEEVEAMVKAVSERLQEARNTIARGEQSTQREVEGVPLHGESNKVERVETAVAHDELVKLNRELCELPEGFTVNQRLLRVLQRRCAVQAPESRIDWGHAEALAFASIVADGVPIRLTGQDSARGTFSQRHAVIHDQRTGGTYTPLQHLPSARATFAIYNSPLSENAVLGFEYGYSAHAPGAFVIWEAQYGDFANGAQAITDQFIVSARAKWGVRPALALLLPHGYEGQGAEHSSGRLERFLELAAEDNLFVANCTTAAQYFHLLRRHAVLLRRDPRPLVLLSPKSLLRLPEAASQLSDLASGAFQPVIDDAQARERAAQVTRLVLCSGKVYYDLAASEARRSSAELAVARLEMLYPLPVAELQLLFNSYPRLREVAWVQEEPANMGAWPYLASRLEPLLPEAVALTYVGRPRRASPAEGSSEWHAEEQARIVAEASRGFAKPQQMIRGARHAG
ncbi:MAG: 2-oxoglutarate dehydrogenase E1 component [Chloroflexota bacterium]